MTRRFRSMAVALFAGAVIMSAVVASESKPQMDSRSEDTRKLAAEEWPLVGGDLGGTHYSTLSQINTDNVKNLGAVWMSKKYEENIPSRVTPVVKDGRIFVTAGSHVYALDAQSGEIKWSVRTDTRPVPRTNHEIQEGGVGIPNAMGVATGEGLVFVGLEDGRVAALGQTDGEIVWSRQVGDNPPPKREGIQVSDPPIYWNGVVYVGMSADYGLRGRIVALDAKTGQEQWRFFTTPDPGEKGHETWSQDNDVYKRGGGGVWQPGTVDPDLGIVFYATGNAVPQLSGRMRPGDNLYTVSVVALDMKTGKLKWHYQVIHHDLWDADIAVPLILYTAQVDGQPRKALAAIRSDGYMFLLDRQTGKPLIPVEERAVPQSPVEKTAATQPFPVGAESILPACDASKMKIPTGFVLSCSNYTPPRGEASNVLAPGFGVRFTPMSFSPQTGYFYAQGTSDTVWIRQPTDPYFDGHFGGTVPGLQNTSVLAAVDSKTAKVAWRKEMSPRVFGRGATLTTAGGLMFRLGGDGNFVAYNAKTGDVLWQFQTGSTGAGGAPVAYDVKGEEYIAVTVGPDVMCFKLGGTMQPLQAPRIPQESADGFNGPIEDTAQIETVSLQTSRVTAGTRFFVDENMFNPYRARVHIANGQARVTWVNNGSLTHTITALDGSWTTGPMSPAGFASVTFDKPGSYVYVWKEQPWTYGEVIVVGEDTQARAGSSFYTEEQAARGKALVTQNCASCHGANLDGIDRTPGLVGDVFALHWDGQSVGDLFTRISTTMPQNKPGSLPPDAYVDITAYLLQANGYPGGRQELKNDPKALKGMTISKK